MTRVVDKYIGNNAAGVEARQKLFNPGRVGKIDDRSLVTLRIRQCCSNGFQFFRITSNEDRVGARGCGMVGDLEADAIARAANQNCCVMVISPSECRGRKVSQAGNWFTAALA